MKISGMDLIKALVADGYKTVKLDGSHVQLQKEGRNVTVPLYAELHDGLLHYISTQVGCSKAELVRMVSER
jgi:predicted RNA binding protein YcfA (HicA-like mRNA interferase family)